MTEVYISWVCICGRETAIIVFGGYFCRWAFPGAVDANADGME